MVKDKPTNQGAPSPNQISVLNNITDVHKLFRYRWPQYCNSYHLYLEFDLFPPTTTINVTNLSCRFLTLTPVWDRSNKAIVTPVAVWIIKNTVLYRFDHALSLVELYRIQIFPGLPNLVALSL